MYRKTKNEYRQDTLKVLEPLVNKRMWLCTEITKRLFLNYSTSELKYMAGVLKVGELEPVLKLIQQ